MGASYIGIHMAIDEQMQGKTPWDTLREVAQAVSIPVAVAGGINSETAALAIEAGASIVIVGGAITKAADATAATRTDQAGHGDLVAVESEFFVRATGPDIREMLGRVSAANVSDALHRSGDIPGIAAADPGHQAGAARRSPSAPTPATGPSRWRPSTMAQPGDVLVIDAGGVAPGRLGRTGHQLRHPDAGWPAWSSTGGARDTGDIRALGFPLFSHARHPHRRRAQGLRRDRRAHHASPACGVSPGDWIIGDDDGVCVIPKEKAVEYTNRAMDVLEKENRLRKEIQAGSTLSQVGYLQQWEKR